MNYSYYNAPTQPYQYFVIPDKTAHPFTPQTDIQQDPLDAFTDPMYPYFDQDPNFNPSALIAPPQSPPHSLHHGHSIPNLSQYESTDSIPQSELNVETEFGDRGVRQGSSDEDKDNMTPAQTRRKAQNRAAQRAFRERKERHVKDLEVKLKSIEAQSTDLLTDNERLRRELDKLATQNEILRATSSPPRPSGASYSHFQDREHADPEPLTAGPMHYSPRSFNAAFAAHGATSSDEPISHRVAVSKTGERLLATGAAWDFIQRHDLYRRGMVDLAEVIDRLREKAVCDGAGPSFPESEVIRAIEESVGVPGDELI